MRQIKEIILHCSDTKPLESVTFEVIKEWHTLPVEQKGNGWNDIGYHHVITTDGFIHDGREHATIGAHCYGHNKHSIGVCLVGGRIDVRTGKAFEAEQFTSLARLIRYLYKTYGELPIIGHNEYDKGKTCPVFHVSDFIVEYLVG